MLTIIKFQTEALTNQTVIAWHYEELSVIVKPLDTPFGPSYDLECAENAKIRSRSPEMVSKLVHVQHYGVRSDNCGQDMQLIYEADVNVTSSKPIVIQLNQVSQ